jgi:hypothetical protein
MKLSKMGSFVFRLMIAAKNARATYLCNVKNDERWRAGWLTYENPSPHEKFIGSKRKPPEGREVNEDIRGDEHDKFQDGDDEDTKGDNPDGS